MSTVTPQDHTNAGDASQSANAAGSAQEANEATAAAPHAADEAATVNAAGDEVQKEPVVATSPSAHAETTPAKHAVASNPLRPSEADAPPSSGARHVRFHGAPPAVADLVFELSPVQPARKSRSKTRAMATGGSPSDKETVVAAPKAAEDAEQPAKDGAAAGEAAVDGDTAGGAATAAAGEEDTDVTSSDDEDLDNPDLDIGERLYLRGQKAQRRRERVARRAAKAAATTADCTFKPEISKLAMEKRSGSWNAFLQNINDQAQRSKRHFEKKKEQIVKEWEEECAPEQRAKPGELSEALVEQLRADGKYAGPVRHWHKHFARFLVKRSGSPRHVVAAAGAAVDQSRNSAAAGSVDRGSRRSASETRARAEKTEESQVFDRLYRQAETRRAAQELMVAAQIDAEDTTLFRPLTNHRLSRIHAGAQDSLRRGRSPVVAGGPEWSVASSGGGGGGVAARHDERQRQLLRAMAAPEADSLEFGSFLMSGQYTGDDDGSAGAGGEGFLSGDAAAYDDEGEEGDDGAAEMDVVELDLDEYLRSGDPSPPRRPDEVVEGLMLKAREYEARRIERERKAKEDALTGCTFKPYTNPKSKEILQRVATKVVTGTYARSRSQTATHDVADDMEFSAAVKGAPAPYMLRRSESELIRAAGGSGGATGPHGSPNRVRLHYPNTSARVAAGYVPRGEDGLKPKKFDVDIFTARALRISAEKTDKIRQMQAEREATSLAECTFRPRISEFSRHCSNREPKIATSPHFNAMPRSTVHNSTGASAASPRPRTPPATQKGGAAAKSGQHPIAAAAAAHPRHGVSTDLSAAFSRAAAQSHTPTQAHPGASSSARTVPSASAVPKRSPAPSASSSAAAHRRGTGRASPMSTPRSVGGGGGSAANVDDAVAAANDVSALDDGMAYLTALEQELQSVLEDWRRVE
jgi:hypothetical protein